MLVNLASTLAGGGKLAGIVAVVALLLGTVSGYLFADARRVAEIESIKRTYAEERQRIEADKSRQLERAMVVGREASAKLLKTEARLRRAARRIRNAKNIYTTGRNCLSANAVRMLNSSETIAEGLHLSNTTSGNRSKNGGKGTAIN